jgi:O-acetyl-ADP-ribose deacetylase (regulator of RNase III)
MPSFLFFDTKYDLISTLESKLSRFSNVWFSVGKIEDLITTEKMDAIVSPANSFGFMDGGIDRNYMLLFPGIEEKVKDNIEKIGVLNSANRKHMPIGSAFYVSVYSPPCPVKWLISAPTMYLPQNIEGTRNVYFAMTAILELTKDWTPELVVAIPGLGTGIGEISSDSHAQQIYEAMTDFQKGKKMLDPSIKEYKYGNCYVLSRGACAQRELYCNDPNNEVEAHW